MQSSQNYIGYDYKTISVDGAKTSMILDAYKNFGWAADDSIPTRQLTGMVALKLKRDRKILNKAELTRLQQHFEACVDEIEALERSKTRKATVFSLVAGIIGTVFLAGSVFAVTAEPPITWLCVLLGIPGLIGWALPYLLYRVFEKKRSEEVMPLVERKYDEIHEICEKGNALIH